MTPGVLPTDQGRSCARGLWKAFKMHIGPILIFLAFTFSGAAIFEKLEGPFELEAIGNVRRLREEFLQDLFLSARAGNLPEYNWTEYAKARLLEFEGLRTSQLQPAFPLDGTEDERLWTFWGAGLYCGTIYTTIGYGLMCPKTTEGKVATILYAMLGIPLCMIILANLGKLMALALRKIHWLIWKLFKYTKAAGTAAGHMAEGAAGAVGDMASKLSVKSKRASLNATGSDDHLAKPESDLNDEVEEGETARILDTGLMAQDAKRSPGGATEGRQAADSPSEKRDLQIFEEAPDDMESEQDVSPSVLFPIVVLIVYILLGAWMYDSWEKWGFFESSYFIVISLSTVGLGDISPSHPKFFMASSIYILFGLTLVSFVINVILLALRKTIARAQQAPGRFIAIGKRYTGKKEEVIVEQSQDEGHKDNVKVSIADQKEQQVML